MATEHEQSQPEAFTYDGWAVVEIYGHRRTGGRVKPQVLGPAMWIRIDVPNRAGQFTTQFYNPGSIFSLTPSGEREARAVAYANEPEPVSRWEMKQLDAPAPRPHVVDAEQRYTDDDLDPDDPQVLADQENRLQADLHPDEEERLQAAALDEKFGRVVVLRKKLLDEGLDSGELEELKRLESEVGQSITELTS